MAPVEMCLLIVYSQVLSKRKREHLSRWGLHGVGVGEGHEVEGEGGTVGGREGGG